MAKRGLMALAVSFVLHLPTGGGVWAAEAEIEEAKADFQTYCASCHGREGKGDGPVASELVTKPLSLQQIAKRRGGVFDADEVHRFVDGRDMPRAHGTPEMPVWGVLFAFQAQASGILQDQIVEAEKAARLRIKGLVKYLETIQER
jgi:mono/diheme cytochrome c family protein